MSRKMLINAKHEEECRVAVIENGMLLSFNVEKAGSLKTKGNVYKATILRVEPSLQAVFVNYGSKKNGFLPFRDIHPTYFRCEYPENNPHNVNIQEALKPGQELVVQVLREESDIKGAALTTYLSIPGRYTVLLPGSEQRGISQKITDPKQRERFKEMLAEMDIPDGLGLIVRTAGEGRTKIEIKKDLSYVLRLWNEIKDKVMQQPNPSLLYEESDLASTMVRDYFTAEVSEILVDNKPVCTRIKSFVETVMPRYRSRVKYYQHEEPLFDRYSIESQVDEIFSPRVSLKSGGFLVLTQTEAMVTIDINSGRFKSCDDIEETAYRINMEAANAIARHLSLRDMGGIIAIDFIDMRSKKHRLNVEKEIKSCFRNDKAKTDFGKIDQFGVLVMSRQRLGTSLQQIISKPCPNCNGTGLVRAPETIAVQVLRETRKISLRDNIAVLTITASKDVASYLLNKKRAIIADMEKKATATIMVQWDDDFANNQYTFSILTRDGQDSKDVQPSAARPSNYGNQNGNRDRQPQPQGQQNRQSQNAPRNGQQPQPRDRYQRDNRSQAAPQTAPQTAPQPSPSEVAGQMAEAPARIPTIVREADQALSELQGIKPENLSPQGSQDQTPTEGQAAVQKRDNQNRRGRGRSRSSRGGSRQYRDNGPRPGSSQESPAAESAAPTVVTVSEPAAAPAPTPAPVQAPVPAPVPAAAAPAAPAVSPKAQPAPEKPAAEEKKPAVRKTTARKTTTSRARTTKAATVKVEKAETVQKKAPVDKPAAAAPAAEKPAAEKPATEEKKPAARKTATRKTTTSRARTAGTAKKAPAKKAAEKPADSDKPRTEAKDKTEA